jgi:hypothetical protein
MRPGFVFFLGLVALVDPLALRGSDDFDESLKNMPREERVRALRALTWVRPW